MDVANAGRYPDLLVQGSYGLRWGLWPSEHPEGVSTLADAGQLGVYLTAPLFEGGRVTAEAAAARARLEASRWRLRQAELRARLEIGAARLELDATLQRVALSDAKNERERWPNLMNPIGF